MTDFKIGTTYANMVDLNTFFYDSRDREPRAMSMDYAERIEAGDGSRPGMGWMEQKWVWGRLTEHYWNHLMAFVNIPIYVRTRKNDGTFEYYTAVMIIDRDEPEHFAGRVINAELTLRCLTEYLIMNTELVISDLYSTAQADTVVLT